MEYLTKENIVNSTWINGNNGFTITGLNYNDGFGSSISNAGDLNGDGKNDIIIGAPNAGVGPTDDPVSSAGQSYVIYGSNNGFPAEFSISSLNGVNGFTINGINSDDGSGTAVSYAGDVNADGIDDVIIGAPNAGQSYVVFGSKNGFVAQFNLANLNGTNGFTVNGINNGDNSGFAVSGAGDINSDGINDVIIGAHSSGCAGQSYVIFGSKNAFPAQFDLASLNSTNGFIINGISDNNVDDGDCDSDTGYSVSNLGDVNHDGIADVIIGGPQVYNNAGQSYVIFGSKNGFVAQFNLTN